MSAVLNCQVYSTTHFYWEGPDEEYILTDDLDINPDCSNKLKIVGNINNGEYNIKIDNITEKDEGMYACFLINIKHRKLYPTFVSLIIQGKYSNSYTIKEIEL